MNDAGVGAQGTEDVNASPSTIPDVLAQWRNERRAQLRARRLAAPAARRREWNDAIAHWLAEGFSALPLKTVGAYWPLDGEFDPRRTMRILTRCGVKVALPAVRARARPLEFREWWPAAPMRRGVLGIAFPDGTSLLKPDALLIPLLGFDAHGFRLGLGGGYFDRTLAAMAPQPLKVGIGYDICALSTIHPQWHDIPMDFIVTETGIRWVNRVGLQRVAEPALVAELANAILARYRGGDTAAPFASPPCYAHEFDLYGEHDADRD